MNRDTDQRDQASGQTSRPGTREGTRYLGAVGLLLVLIIALISVLWVRERRGRGAAERDRDAALEKYDELERAVGAVISVALKTQVHSVRREELPTRQAKFENRRRSVLELPPGMGRKLGFAPGDLILVTEDTGETQPVKRD